MYLLYHVKKVKKPEQHPVPILVQYPVGYAWKVQTIPPGLFGSGVEIMIKIILGPPE